MAGQSRRGCRSRGRAGYSFPTRSSPAVGDASSSGLPRRKYALCSISSVQAWKSRSSQHSQRSPTGKWPPSAPTPWERHRSPPKQDVCSCPSGTPRAGENRRMLSPKGTAGKLRSAVRLRSKCDLRGAFSSAAADNSPPVDQRTIAQPALAPATAGSDARERRRRVRPVTTPGVPGQSLLHLRPFVFTPLPSQFSASIHAGSRPRADRIRRATRRHRAHASSPRNLRPNACESRLH